MPVLRLSPADLTTALGSKTIAWMEARTADHPPAAVGPDESAESLSRRVFIARCGLGAGAVIAIALGAETRADAIQKPTGNYCDTHPNADGCNIRPSVIGPHVSAASIAHGHLDLHLTFHKAGLFVAYLKHNPPPIPFGKGAEKLKGVSSLGQPIPIGHHAAGPGQVSIPLGTLGAGHYGVIVVPTHLVRTTDRASAASWVYFTERAGRPTQLRILQP